MGTALDLIPGRAGVLSTGISRVDYVGACMTGAMDRTCLPFEWQCIWYDAIAIGSRLIVMHLSCSPLTLLYTGGHT